MGACQRQPKNIFRLCLVNEQQVPILSQSGFLVLLRSARGVTAGPWKAVGLRRTSWRSTYLPHAGRCDMMLCPGCQWAQKFATLMSPQCSSKTTRPSIRPNERSECSRPAWYWWSSNSKSKVRLVPSDAWGGSTAGWTHRVFRNLSLRKPRRWRVTEFIFRCHGTTEPWPSWPLHPKLVRKDRCGKTKARRSIEFDQISLLQSQGQLQLVSFNRIAHPR